MTAGHYIARKKTASWEAASAVAGFLKTGQLLWQTAAAELQQTSASAKPEFHVNAGCPPARLGPARACVKLCTHPRCIQRKR